jgi:hypothetical protein
LAEFFQKHPKIVNMTMLLGPSVKSQISGAFYSAYHKQPTEGCEDKEVAFMRRTTVVLGLAALMAATVVLTAGAAGEQDSYLPSF